LIIPKTVYDEAIRKGVEMGKYDAYLLEKLVHDGRIQVMQSNKESLKEVQDFFSLHCGESDAISLCKDIKAECLLCDDKKAINACKVLGLKFATALNILSAMHTAGRISNEEANASLNRLEEFGWTHRSIVSKSLAGIIWN
jgi:predicted nucleic acid-binding protein